MLLKAILTGIFVWWICTTSVGSVIVERTDIVCLCVYLLVCVLCVCVHDVQRCFVCDCVWGLCV